MKIYHLLAILPALPTFAHAECGPIEEAREILKREYKEESTIQMADARGLVLEIFVAPDGKTYTAVMVKDGIACKVGEGTNVRVKPFPASGAPS